MPLAPWVALFATGRDEYVAGYMIIPTASKVEASYNAGFSMFVAAWPLLHRYPGHRFQSGLPGTWMFAQYDGAKPKDLYSDVEGGLGWWTDTRFPTETPKFIMGGVAPNFSEIANGPAHGWGDWKDPRGLYGVAQLSPWLLFPIDGLNIAQGASGDWIGYGYLNLPLTEPKGSTAGRPIRTGGNCWTLFMSSDNFKGPVAFFLPHFWSHSFLKNPAYEGQLLDVRPAEPNTAIQMETQYIPCRVAKDRNGVSYMRVATTQFPDGPIIARPTSYDRAALYDSVRSWFDGGAASAGTIDAKRARVRSFKSEGYMTWQVHSPGANGKETKVPIEWKTFAQPAAASEEAFGVRWNLDWARRDGRLVSFPEYFQLVDSADPKKAKWTPVRASQVPAETGLAAIQWTRPVEQSPQPYDTPSDPTSAWKRPGPVAGPFTAKLGDGSVVTYYWYRFADQPAMLNADLSAAERERMQSRVEKLHRDWRTDRDYLNPPKGRLANLDPAQLVRPPKGLEVGYVPIATRQEKRGP